MNRLAAAFASVVAIPKDSVNPLADGVRFLTAPGLNLRMRDAMEKAKAAVALVRTAPDPTGMFRGRDDEFIAGVILEETDKRLKARRGART